MSLSDLQLAAALCEQVYRRADNDQQLDSSEDGNGGFGIELATVSLTRPSWMTQDGVFYYNNATGFVAEVVKAGEKIFVVFRGSDLSSSFGNAINE